MTAEAETVCEEVDGAYVLLINPSIGIVPHGHRGPHAGGP